MKNISQGGLAKIRTERPGLYWSTKPLSMVLCVTSMYTYTWHVCFNIVVNSLKLLPVFSP
jgi:hypothetical protein